MPPNPSEAERRPHPSLKDTGPGDDEQDQTEELAQGGDSDVGGPSVAQTSAATAERFYARLRHELNRRGVDYDALPRLTDPGSSPPCFDHMDVSYEAWLASASLLGATVPYRYDMPAEPNYCWDCTERYKKDAETAGVCRFRHVHFEHTQTVVNAGKKKLIEREFVGISRNRLLNIGDAQHRVYQELTDKSP